MGEHTISCPLCTDVMVYEAIPKQKQTFAEPNTHTWVCESCPGILVEWSDVEDTKSFARRFGGIALTEKVVEGNQLFIKVKRIKAELKDIEESMCILLGLPFSCSPLSSDSLVRVAAKGNASVQLLLQKHHDLEAELHALHETTYMEVHKG